MRAFNWELTRAGCCRNGTDRAVANASRSSRDRSVESSRAPWIYPDGHNHEIQVFMSFRTSSGHAPATALKWVDGVIGDGILGGIDASQTVEGSWRRMGSPIL